MSTEQVFREEVIRELRLGRIDQSKPQAAFFKFYCWFKSQNEVKGLEVRDWKDIFFDVLKKTPSFFSNVKSIPVKKTSLRLIVTTSKHQHKASAGAGRFMEMSQPPGDR